jgi:glycine/D-amino acid oxidase-like deaminating enzyme
MAGLLLAGRRGVRGQSRRVVVAGAGIMGSAVAFRLAQRGAHVTVIEKGQPASAATANSFAWINATFSKQPRAYFELNRLGIFAWRQTDRELAGALDVQWGGSIEWYPDEESARELAEHVRAHQAWGYGARLIDASALRTLEPRLNPGPVVRASHADEEGHVDPVKAAHTLLDRARAAGAIVLTNTEVTGLDRPSGRLRAVRTSTGSVEADMLIVACGVDTPRIAAMAGLDVPLRDSPGLLAHTKPLPRLIDRVVLAPKAHMKQKSDGRIVVGEGFGGSPTTTATLEEGRRALAIASGFLPDLNVDAIDRVTLGWRPLPKDGFPVVGFAPRAADIYVTVMHSGVTLSPFIGRAAAVEILDGVEIDALQPYRVSRFGASSLPEFVASRLARSGA